MCFVWMRCFSIFNLKTERSAQGSGHFPEPGHEGQAGASEKPGIPPVWTLQKAARTEKVNGLLPHLNFPESNF